MEKRKLIISRKGNLKGEDGYKTFSVRIKETMVESLDELVKQTGRSRNELINMLIEFGIQYIEIED